jgi:hypothetical protein
VSTDTDPFGYRERVNEEAQRQLEMLRVTLKVKAEVCGQKAMASDSLGAAYQTGKVMAYDDVLFLLGPEPAWWNDPDTKEPF